MRWYDKGLETGDAPEGRWVRLEAELSKDVANLAAMEVLSSKEPLDVPDRRDAGLRRFPRQHRERPPGPSATCALVDRNPQCR